MPSHSYHPDTHEHELADDCPRCDELAGRPLELDTENFVKAWQRMIDVEWGTDAYRSDNERDLGKKLYEWAVFLERYTPIDPRELPEQLVPA